MSVRVFLSSGDLIADRRYDFGRDLQMRGDLSDAAELYLQATELVPDFASAWFALGDVHEQKNDRESAILAFRRAEEADPDDRLGACLRLMRLGAAELSEMPNGFVRTLFDQYAPKFEMALIDHLGYRGPSLLFKAVLTTRNAARKPAFFKRALDLGCGTGLGARAFAKQVSEFTGVDLSPRMIDKARDTGLYAHLEVAEMVQALRARDAEAFDLILIADAAVYLKDLDPLFEEAARVLSRGGLLALTLETHDGVGIILGEGLRYAHGAAYVREVINDAVLVLSQLEKQSTRNENNEPVPGLVIVAAKG